MTQEPGWSILFSPGFHRIPMRTFTFLLALLCLGMAIYILRTPEPISMDDFVDPAAYYGGKTIEDPGPPLRDENGALLPLDPADDLAGFVRNTETPFVLPVSVRQSIDLEAYKCCAWSRAHRA